jgi:hypothetical protein
MLLISMILQRVVKLCLFDERSEIDRAFQTLTPALAKDFSVICNLDLG